MSMTVRPVNIIDATQVTTTGVPINGSGELFSPGTGQQGGDAWINGTITFDAPLTTTMIDDNENVFADDDSGTDGQQQNFTTNTTIGGTTYSSTGQIEVEFHLIVVTPDGVQYTISALNIGGPGGASGDFQTIQAFAPVYDAVTAGGTKYPPPGVPLTIIDAIDLQPNPSNYELYFCFARGTRIQTDDGERAVQDLEVGDLVQTVDHGRESIRWIGRLTVPGVGQSAPVVFMPGSVENDAELTTSQHHRFLVCGSKVDLAIGVSEALLEARDLVNGDTIYIDERAEVEYFHLLFDQHQLIYANGAVSESFLPGPASLNKIDKATNDEIYALFPELRFNGAVEPARPILKRFEASVVQSI